MSGGAEGKGTVDAPSVAVVAVVAVLLLAPLVFLVVSRTLAEPDPTEYERELNRAQKALDANKPRESLVALARAERLRPDTFAVHNNYCVAYGLLKRRREAVERCERALRAEPGSPLARNNLAWVRSLEPERP